MLIENICNTKSRENIEYRFEYPLEGQRQRSKLG